MTESQKLRKLADWYAEFLKRYSDTFINSLAIKPDNLHAIADRLEKVPTDEEIADEIEAEVHTYVVNALENPSFIGFGARIEDHYRSGVQTGIQMMRDKMLGK